MKLELLCETCGTSYRRPASNIKKHSFCGKECFYKWLSKNHKLNKNISTRNYHGDKNPCWRGGRYNHGDGYIMVYKPNNPMANKDGYILEHRLVMSDYLNRKLLPSEKIHHINGIKTDNRIENLQIITQSDHIKLHGLPGVKTMLGHKHSEETKNKMVKSHQLRKKR